ncbi:glycerol-3-phosphate 1-O-acyltransferase PlsY [Streptococcaceae bacterium ESL0687]|nr:glycerol-3-phosphate 1-O-acyltransferase PlsY [Streptococcaceae bacterium ESL0687]
MKVIILLITAYLLGSIPSGLWIGKIFFGKNLHDYGSGNTGTTNTFRILGKKAGIVVFICDVLKGVIATALPMIFHVHGISPAIFGLVAIFGHTCSIFDGFKGGKAVATSAGMILTYNPLFFLFLFIVFMIALYLTSMVSFSSITICLAAILAVTVFPAFHFIFKSYDPVFLILILVLATFIIYKHRDNLKRIKNHEENLVPFGLNLTKQKPKK